MGDRVHEGKKSEWVLVVLVGALYPSIGRGAYREGGSEEELE